MDTQGFFGRVVVVYPTANRLRSDDTLKAWHEKGHKSLVLVNSGWGTPCTWVFGSGWVMGHPISDGYKGYCWAQNLLAREAMRRVAAAVVCAGDDMDPDPKKSPEEILGECVEKFAGGPWVMQPCGDPQGKDGDGVPAAARICGSPWLSPEYIRRGYGGSGPYPSHYSHFYGDEELKVVAERLGILWLRYDVEQKHRHWSWGHTKKEGYQTAMQGFWDGDKGVFDERKAAGFPGHELGPVA